MGDDVSINLHNLWSETNFKNGNWGIQPFYLLFSLGNLSLHVIPLLINLINGLVDLFAKNLPKITLDLNVVNRDTIRYKWSKRCCV